jgi:hypothetical protein
LEADASAAQAEGSRKPAHTGAGRDARHDLIERDVAANCAAATNDRCERLRVAGSVQLLTLFSTAKGNMQA